MLSSLDQTMQLGAPARYGDHLHDGFVTLVARDSIHQSSAIGDLLQQISLNSDPLWWWIVIVGAGHGITRPAFPSTPSCTTFLESRFTPCSPLSVDTESRCYGFLINILETYDNKQ
jgi:hypothetical protein